MDAVNFTVYCLGGGSQNTATRTFSETERLVPKLLDSGVAVSHLTSSVLKVVSHKSTPPQIRRHIIYYEYFDEFVWELTFAKRLEKHCV